MFKDRGLLITGGTGSIGSSICKYFNNNGCKEIYSTTTDLNKVKSDQDYIKFKELNLNNIENLNLDELFDFEVIKLMLNFIFLSKKYIIINRGIRRPNCFNKKVEGNIK